MSKIKYATLSLSDDQNGQQQEQLFQTVLQTTDCNNKNVQNRHNNFEICNIATNTTTTSLSSTAITTANSYLNDASFSFINTPVINDVFTQEANFAVSNINKTWSTTTTTASTQQQQIIDTNSTLTPPIFSVPQNVCIKPTFDDDATHWHGSTDLLELDHRYNSCLQNDLLQTDNPSVIVNTDNQPEAISELSEFMNRNGASGKVILTTHKSVQNQYSSELSQQQQQQVNRVSSDSESDFEDRNLSWLLNFKFDEFPHLSPDAATLSSKNRINFNMTNLNLNSSNKNVRKTTTNSAGSPSSDSTITANQTQMPESNSKKKFEELVLEATSDMDCTENIENDNPVLDDMSYRMGKKPPFTYTELIEYALEDKGELTVSGIYQWIS